MSVLTIAPMSFLMQWTKLCLKIKQIRICIKNLTIEMQNDLDIFFIQVLNGVFELLKVDRGVFDSMKNNL